MKQQFPLTVDGLVAASRGDRPPAAVLLRIADKVDASLSPAPRYEVMRPSRWLVALAGCAVIASGVATTTVYRGTNAPPVGGGPESADISRSALSVPPGKDDSKHAGDNPGIETPAIDVYALPGSAERPARPTRLAPETVSEGALLQLAHDALASNPRRALALTVEHERRFPSGSLIQEREVIAIDALGRLGRTQDARARAAAFFTAYPSSAYRKGVSEAIGAMAAPVSSPEAHQ